MCRSWLLGHFYKLGFMSLVNCMFQDQEYNHKLVSKAVTYLQQSYLLSYQRSYACCKPQVQEHYESDLASFYLLYQSCHLVKISSQNLVLNHNEQPKGSLHCLDYPWEFSLMFQFLVLHLSCESMCMFQGQVFNSSSICKIYFLHWHFSHRDS